MSSFKLNCFRFSLILDGFGAMIMILLLLLQTIFGLSLLIDGNVVKFSYASNRELADDSKRSTCWCSSSAHWIKHHNLLNISYSSIPLWGTYRPGFYFGELISERFYIVFLTFHIVNFNCCHSTKVCNLNFLFQA